MVLIYFMPEDMSDVDGEAQKHYWGRYNGLGGLDSRYDTGAGGAMKYLLERKKNHQLTQELSQKGLSEEQVRQIIFSEIRKDSDTQAAPGNPSEYGGIAMDNIKVENASKDSRIAVFQIDPAQLAALKEANGLNVHIDSITPMPLETLPVFLDLT
jgi:hypothetical protein